MINIAQRIRVWDRNRKNRIQAIENEARMKRVRKIAEVQEFAMPGTTFYYLGYRHVCTGSGYILPWVEPGVRKTVCIRAEYVNPVTGEIVDVFYPHSQLPVLEAEKKFAGY